jgi:hypothetical protein
VCVITIVNVVVGVVVGVDTVVVVFVSCYK